MFRSSKDRAIVILSAELKRTRRLAVDERVKAGKCLLCETEPWKRGLCIRCYARFRRELNKLEDPVHRAEFEAEHIREGNILASAQGRREDESIPNPFKSKVS